MSLQAVYLFNLSLSNFPAVPSVPTATLWLTHLRSQKKIFGLIISGETGLRRAPSRKMLCGETIHLHRRLYLFRPVAKKRCHDLKRGTPTNTYTYSAQLDSCNIPGLMNPILLSTSNCVRANQKYRGHNAHY